MKRRGQAILIATVLVLSGLITSTAAAPATTQVVQVETAVDQPGGQGSPGDFTVEDSAVEPTVEPEEGVPGAEQPSDGVTPGPGTEAPGMEEPPGTAELSQPIFSMSQGERKVVLTFDDGPSPQTRSILSILAEEGVPAVFFWIAGQQGLEMAPEVVAAGHRLGTHTTSHPNLTLLNRAGQESQLAESVRRLEVASGADVRLFRPPYGAYDHTTLQLASELGLGTILWNVDSQDWALADNPDLIVANVLEQVEDGAIILLHERPQTLQVLPRLIHSLRAQGYAFSLL